MNQAVLIKLHDVSNLLMFYELFVHKGCFRKSFQQINSIPILDRFQMFEMLKKE